MQAVAIAALVGTGVTAVSQYQAGKQANEIAKAEAGQLEQNAKLARETAGYEAGRQRELGHRLRDKQISEIGASGFTLEGSPSELIQETATEVEMDALMLQRRGLIESNRYLSEAETRRAEGKSAKRAGTMNAFSKLLAGATDFWSTYGGKTGVQTAARRSGVSRYGSKAATGRTSSGGFIFG